MIKRCHKITAEILLIMVFASFFTCFAAAKGNWVSVKEHNFSVQLPEDYTEINTDNSKKNSELIESFGYSVSSFNTYLKSNNIILFATDPNQKTQLTVTTWESNFSKDIKDLSYLGDEALSTVAGNLITTKGATYKTVTVNSMKMLEVRKNDKDSGGEFCTVQYLTIRNGNFYSVTLAFPDTLDETKGQVAWDLICSLNIKDTSSGMVWDVTSITQVILIWGLIVVAIVAIVFIIISFVKDIVKSRNEANAGTEVIERRDRFKWKK